MPSPHPSDRVRMAVDLLSAMAELPTTVSVAGLAARLGWSPRDCESTLAAMERRAMVETWPDPDRIGSILVMLSAQAARRLGLELSRCGGRWSPSRPGPAPVAFEFRRRFARSG